MPSSISQVMIVDYDYDDDVPGLGPEHRHTGDHHPHACRAHGAHRGDQAPHWSRLDHVTRMLLSDWSTVRGPPPTPEPRAASHISSVSRRLSNI